MSKVKNILYTVSAGAVLGMVAGILFAPAKGRDTRARLRALKDKLSCAHHDIDDNKEALEELSDILKEQLAVVNKKLDKLS